MKAVDRRAAALDNIETRERRGLVRDLVQQTRVEDVQRQAQTKQRQREARETAYDITAARTDDARSADDERRARMLERLQQARQQPSAPRRSGPGWE